MRISFFPGCSLEGTAREFGESIQSVCKSLDVRLEEIKDWSCCGASSAHCTSEYLSIALPARNLSIAEKTGKDLVTPCAACFSRLKTAAAMITDESKADFEFPCTGKISILHILEFLCQHDFSEKIDKLIKKPLKNLKAVSYYGCLLVRPPEITDAEHWEDPTTLDILVSRLGAESVFWPYKTECCGGSLVLTRVDVAKKLISRLLDMAGEADADCIVTACPLCQANLDTRQDEIASEKGVGQEIPVFYFTELMGLAFGLEGTGKWFRRHIVDPRPLLKSKNLI